MSSWGCGDCIFWVQGLGSRVSVNLRLCGLRAGSSKHTSHTWGRKSQATTRGTAATLKQRATISPSSSSSSRPADRQASRPAYQHQRQHHHHHHHRHHHHSNKNDDDDSSSNNNYKYYYCFVRRYAGSAKAAITGLRLLPLLPLVRFSIIASRWHRIRVALQPWPLVLKGFVFVVC